MRIGTDATNLKGKMSIADFNRLTKTKSNTAKQLYAAKQYLVEGLNIREISLKSDNVLLLIADLAREHGLNSINRYSYLRWFVYGIKDQ